MYLPGEQGPGAVGMIGKPRPVIPAWNSVLMSMLQHTANRPNLPRPSPGMARAQNVSAAQAKVNEHLRRIQAARAYARRR